MLLRVWLQMSVYTIQVEAEFVVRTVVKNLDTVEIKTVFRIAFNMIVNFGCKFLSDIVMLMLDMLTCLKKFFHIEN